MRERETERQRETERDRETERYIKKREIFFPRFVNKGKKGREAIYNNYYCN